MVDITNAYLRKKTWYFRIRVPAKLKEHYNGKTFITQSLRTKDPLEAQKQADALSRQHKAAFDALKTENLPKVASYVRESTSAKFEDLVDTSFIEKSLNQHANPDTFSNREINLIMRRGLEIHIKLENALKDDDGLTENYLKSIELSPIVPDVQNVYELCQQTSGEQDLSTNHGLRHKTARDTIDLLRELVKNIGYMVSPIIGTKRRIPFPASLTQFAPESSSEPTSHQKATEPRKQTTSNTPLLSEAFEKLIAQEEPEESHLVALREGVDLFTEWAGDKPVAEYTVDDVVDYRNNCLRKLPSRRTTKKIYRGKSLRAVIKTASPDEYIAPTTIDNKLSRICTVFGYATKRGWIQLNPATGFGEDKPKTSRAPDKSYTDEELQKLFDVMEYDPKSPAKYWVILFALYNGMRANEASQLHLSDIVTEDNIPCFDINENDKQETQKSVKNRSSCRIIPIHPELIKAGFLNYVEERKAEVGVKNALLFPDVVYSSKNGYAERIVKWFGRTLKPQFLAPERMKGRALHAFRHTFGKYAQNQARMVSQAEHELMGHKYKGSSSTHSIYTGRLPPKILLEELEKLDFGLTIPNNPYT